MIVAVLTSLTAIFYFSVNAVIAQSVAPRLDRLEDGQAELIRRFENGQSEIAARFDKIEQTQQTILEKL